jgi:4-diphosphocytidyl-2-C-methyl-D-erythritol kinase
MENVRLISYLKSFLVLMKYLFNKKTPAKINLHLRILGKYENGYHKIETVFLPIEIWDELEIKLRNDYKIELAILNSNIPNDETNLCYKAASIFAKSVKKFQGCSIQMKKKIPVGAGLGGGSSDSAATLLGLNELYESPLDQNELFSLAAQLGADVPFFLNPGLAIGRGKGELLEHIERAWDLWILVVCPTFEISTRWAFSKYKIGLTKDKKNIILNSQFLRDVQVDVFYEFFENEFESLVFSHYPELGKMKQRLYCEGASFASLSGTGSTVYGLFKDKKTAKLAETAFKDGNETFVVKPVNTHGN